MQNKNISEQSNQLSLFEPYILQIEDYIPYGSDKAITRDELCAVTNMSDRVVRKHIEDARRRGIVIVNKQNGAGYYQSDDLDDIEAQFRINRARAMAILVQQKHLYNRLKAAGVPVTWRLDKAQ